MKIILIKQKAIYKIHKIFNVEINFPELEEIHCFHFYVSFYLSPLYLKQEAISSIFPNSDIIS